MWKENKKGEHAQLKYLYSHTDTEKRRFILGAELYDFVDFCKKIIPAGETYNFSGVEGLNMVRARYILWPAIMKQVDPEFILIYKTGAAIPDNYEVFKRFLDIGVILKKKEAAK
jgi:hypothetical protein